MIGLDHRDGWQKVWIGSFVCFHMVDVKSDLAETEAYEERFIELGVCQFCASRLFGNSMQKVAIFNCLSIGN